MYLFLLLILFAGCATSPGYLPKHAIMDPKEGISIVHPEIAQKQENIFVRFFPVASPKIFVEALGDQGIFPVIGYSSIDNSEIKGKCYIKELSWAGVYILSAEIIGKILTDLESYKFVISYRDGGKLFTLDGSEIFEYEPEKFDSDKQAKKEIFSKYGMSVRDLNTFWFTFFDSRSEENIYEAQEIPIKKGDPKWEAYKREIYCLMDKHYKKDGKIDRLGWIDTEKFAKEATKNNRLTAKDRFMEVFSLSLTPFTMLNPAGSIGAQVVNGAIAANMDKNWSGLNSRATVQRIEMSENFQTIFQKYSILLEKKDEKIRKLENEIKQLKNK